MCEVTCIELVKEFHPLNTRTETKDKRRQLLASKEFRLAERLYYSHRVHCRFPTQLE
mgnify:CR=1 FL=1